MNLAMVSYLVQEYDEAINYFVETLGFELLEDTLISSEKRWVRVGCSKGIELLLARAQGARQIASIGNQFGGRVGLFLKSSNFDADYKKFCKAGVNFTETVRKMPYGRVVVFEDLYGQRWDLLEDIGANK